VITEDEVMRVLERADPVRLGDATPPVDAAGYLDALRTRSTTVALIDIEPPPPVRPPRRHRRLTITAAIAAAAVVAILGGALVLAARDDPSEPQIPASPTTVAQQPAAAEATARGFVEAWSAFDADRTMASLTDDALAAQWGTEEELRLSLAFLDAVRSKTLNIDCEQRGESAAGILVRCTYDNHVLRSDGLGLGPYSGNYWDLTVRDGQIVLAMQGFDGTDEFSAQLWEPFRRWVTAAYPHHVADMYDGSGWRISEESIRRWEWHVREYITSGAAYAEAGFIGLPPEGATPSTPERGALVDEYHVAQGAYRFAGRARLYADGRLIWRMYLPPGGWSSSTGWLEQRLTPAGVELVRSHATVDEKSPVRLHEWLPASAWDDQQARAFVPVSYAVCLGVVDPNATPESPPMPDPPLEELLDLLPAPAADLLRGREAVPHLPDVEPGPRPCPGLTTEDARLLDTALSDAGFEQDEQTNAYLLEYHVDYPGQVGTRLRIDFEPVFPDGTMDCSACG
jgi:hypothetical protein